MAPFYRWEGCGQGQGCGGKWANELLQSQRELVAAGIVRGGRRPVSTQLLSHTPRARLIIAHYVLNLGTAGPGSGIASHQSELFKGAESWPLG